MNTHTLMFILLVAMFAIRGGFFVAGKIGKQAVTKVDTQHSAVAAHTDPVTLVAPDPAPTDMSSPVWRGAYGSDEDWA